MSEKIFQVLSILKAIDERTGIADLDRASQDILRAIAIEHDSDGPICVGDLARRADLGSAPSIYSKLKILSEEGWIESVSDKADGRMRRLIPTKKAMRAFRQQSKALNFQLGVPGHLDKR